MTSAGKLPYEERSLTNHPAARRTAVILLHGSGGALSPNFPFRALIAELVGRNLTVIIARYEDVTRGSLTTTDSNIKKWVSAVQDLAAALHARTDVAKVLMFGHSSGGSIALATASVDPSISAVAVCAASLPDDYVTPSLQLPPVLVIHNDDDPVIPVFNAKQLQTLCDRNGLPCQFQFFPAGGHGFVGPRGVAVKHLIVNFLLQHSN